MLWYVATPYTNYAGGHAAASVLACQSTAWLLAAGVQCFSPIAHSHYVSAYLDPDIRMSHEFWMWADAPLMVASDGLIVVCAPGWLESKGTQEEIRRFEAAGKPVIYWRQGDTIPTEVFAGTSTLSAR